jgi:hypothetical protein
LSDGIFDIVNPVFGDDEAAVHIPDDVDAGIDFSNEAGILEIEELIPVEPRQPTGCGNPDKAFLVLVNGADDLALQAIPAVNLLDIYVVIAASIGLGPAWYGKGRGQ